MAKFAYVMFLIVMLFLGHSSTIEGARKVFNDGGNPDYCVIPPCCVKPPFCKPTPPVLPTHDDAKTVDPAPIPHRQ
ncbi:hypothetical protein L195_g008073 [Trifolium pratense]|uniref:Uncharacterized protein n=1 Tax=Trifolium pratense TaxID=57577 RepID=A0A2K3P856_TRIPR|nr:hypothetical protein L195_g008073 [Trifolium pratense]